MYITRVLGLRLIFVLCEFNSYLHIKKILKFCNIVMLALFVEYIVLVYKCYY